MKFIGLGCLLMKYLVQNNFITNIIWQKNYASKNDAKYCSDSHDFVLCYAKNKINGDTKIGCDKEIDFDEQISRTTSL